MTDLAALGRGIGYAGVLATVGASAAIALGRRTGITEIPTFAAKARIGAALLVLGGAALRLQGQIAEFVEPGEPIDAAAAGMVLDTRWGANWKVQVGVAAVALLLAVWRTARGSGERPMRAAAAALAITLPLTGHAQEFPLGSAAGVLVQGLHVLGAGLWLGTLAVLAWPMAELLRPLDPAGRRERLGTLGTAFSPVALTGAAIAVGAGVALSVANVGSVAALTGTGYGRLVLLKVALVGAAAALGAYNWRVAVPRVEREGDAGPLGRAASAELAIAAGLLALTTILSVTAAPALE